MRCKPLGRDRHGMTILEFVIVAIVVLFLLAMLMPATSGLKVKANRTEFETI